MAERPLRDKWEEATEEVPEGPAGIVGSGNVLGAAGYFTVSATDVLFDFTPGIKRPGFSIMGSEVVNENPQTVTKEVTVNAAGRNIAKYAAKYSIAPSNADYFRSDPEVVDVEPIRERNLYTKWRVTVVEENEGGLIGKN